MEQKRHNFQSKLSEGLKYNERMIVTLKKSIENIETSLSAGKDSTFYENRIAQTETSIRNYQTKNEELQTKLNVVMSGGCDAEILKKHEEVKDALQKKEEENSKKEIAEKEMNKKRKECSKNFEQRERESSRKDFFAKKDNERSYERYCQISETAPDYILNNVKSMPNNKGYKFKNVFFFGELPAEKNSPVVIFDRKPDGMLITETYSDQEVVYFKPRDGKQKELVRRTRLVKNVNAPATRIPMR
uniref:Uncharacterized protein n=1 Tax=viral metagenome TaxID=1070528 RepID=A0A6C0KS31_9ZZZZ